MPHQGIFRAVLFALLGCAAAFSQAVVSTHAGVLNFAEGAVLIDDQPVQVKAGAFSNVKEGAVLRTEHGRAEVLLTPGVFLRIDENSAFRMVSSELSKPRVEFLRGSAIVDSNDSSGNNPLVLGFKSYDIRFPKPGVYRLDSDPGVFETYTGEAELAAKGEIPKKIDESNQFFFGIGTEIKKYGDGEVDAFSEWARNRATTITADNQASAQSNVDPNDLKGYDALSGGAPAWGGGLPSFGGISPGYGTYNGMIIADNGFYSGPPFFNTFFQPVAVIYLVPWWWRKPPVKSTPPHSSGYPVNTATAHTSGYPTLPPSTLHSFRSAQYQSLPHQSFSSSNGMVLPGRNMLLGHSALRISPPVRSYSPPRVNIAAPHVYAPAPHISGPVGIHR
jgi:hypothetical protein